MAFRLVTPSLSNLKTVDWVARGAMTIRDEKVNTDSAADSTISKERKATAAAAHGCLKRVKGKRVRLNRKS